MLSSLLLLDVCVYTYRVVVCMTHSDLRSEHDPRLGVRLSRCGAEVHWFSVQSSSRLWARPLVAFDCIYKLGRHQLQNCIILIKQSSFITVVSELFI